jgi:N-dimethylarginine dimethylaminohydrolase
MPIMSEDEHRYNQLMKTFTSIPEPPFESREMQELVWGRQWGCSSDVGQIRVILMHRPGEEVRLVTKENYLPEIGSFGDPAKGWYWRGTQPPDLPKMQAHHDGLANALRREGVQVEYLEEVPMRQHKSVSTRDSVVAVKGGAIACRLATPYRRGEELAVTRKLAKLGMPILRTVHGTGIFEGGSFAWLNERTAVVGLSVRVNEEGTRQVEEVLRTQGVELLRLHLTGYRQHIDGVLVMVDVDKVLINPTITPYWFIEKLRELKIKAIELHPDDHPFTINCLAIRPGKVLMSEASNWTIDRLHKKHIEVVTIDYEAVYRGGGGIHCSTAPLIRDPV